MTEKEQSPREDDSEALLGESNDGTNEEEEEVYDPGPTPHHSFPKMLPKSSGTYVIVRNPKTGTFWIGISIFALQTMILTLILLNIFDWNSENPFRIPPAVPIQVTAAQAIALFSTSDDQTIIAHLWRSLAHFCILYISAVTVFSQSDFQAGFATISYGYTESMCKRWPDTARWRMNLAITLWIFNGCFSMFLIFCVIMASTDIVGLLLGATAIGFVNNLDNIAYAMARVDLLGADAKGASHQMVSFWWWHETQYRNKFEELFPRVAMAAAYLVLLIGWLIVVLYQRYGDFTTHFVAVQVQDQLQFLHGTYSGGYRLDQNPSARPALRSVYVSESGRTVIAYCDRDEQWSMFLEGEDRCGDVFGRSRSADLDVTHTQSSWFLTEDPTKPRFFPATGFIIDRGCVTDSDCGGQPDSGVCVQSECRCGEDFYSLRCDYKVSETCTMLEVENGVFEGFGTYASQYSMLKKEERMVQYYNRPMFVSSEESFPDIIFFSGFRWVLTKSSNDFVDSGSNVTSSDIADYFVLNGANIDVATLLLDRQFFITQPVVFNTPSDVSTPIGLSWSLVNRGGPTNASQTNGVPTQPLDTFDVSQKLFCAVCDNITNPCADENICEQTGQCRCEDGSSGSLCQVRPLSDGFCNNDGYNDDRFSFDGGDCCELSCVDTEEYSCGFQTVSNTSETYVGFPNCTDPKALCVGPPCFVQRTASLGRFGAFDQSLVILSPNGRVLLVSEPSQDEVRVYDQIDGEWQQRGEPLQGARKSNFGAVTALATGPALVVQKSNGDHLPTLLAVSFIRFGTTLINVYRWEETYRDWFLIGEPIEVCAIAASTDCTLRSLDLSFHHSMAYVAATLQDDVILVVEAAISQDPQEIPTEELTTWTTTGTLNGKKASLSGNSRFVAVNPPASSRVEKYLLSTAGLTPASDHALSDYYGPLTDLIDFRLSYDGTALIGMVLDSEVTGTLFRLQLSNIENNSTTSQPISMRVPNFDNRTANIKIAGDGTAIGLVERSFDIFAINVYAVKDSLFWQKVGNETSLRDPQRSFTVSNQGRALVVAGYEAISTYQPAPICGRGHNAMRMSMLLPESLKSFNYGIRSFKLVGETLFNTTSVSKSCQNCTEDPTLFSDTFLSDEICLPFGECLEIEVETEGSGQALGIYLVDEHGHVEAIELDSNGTDTVRWLSNNQSCSQEPVLCANNESTVLVMLELDGFPYETSWYANSGGATNNFGSYTGGTPVHQFCVPETTCNSITVLDDGGDGFCCQNGNGKYSIFVDGEVILAKDGDIGRGERVYFGGCDVRIAKPLEATIILTLDESSAARTYWVLRDTFGGGAIVARSEEGEYASLFSPTQTDNSASKAYNETAVISNSTNTTAVISNSSAPNFESVIESFGMYAVKSFGLYPGSRYELQIFVENGNPNSTESNLTPNNETKQSVVGDNNLSVGYTIRLNTTGEILSMSKAPIAVDSVHTFDVFPSCWTEDSNTC